VELDAVETRYPDTFPPDTEHSSDSEHHEAEHRVVETLWSKLYDRGYFRTAPSSFADLLCIDR
jgi:hypothetical protein